MGGPGILDSNFKRTADSRFKLQNGKILDSNFKFDKIPDSKCLISLGFKFQTTFLRFILHSFLKLMGFRIQIWAYRALPLPVVLPPDPYLSVFEKVFNIMVKIRQNYAKE